MRAFCFLFRKHSVKSKASGRFDRAYPRLQFTVVDPWHTDCGA